jgi:hypothetical protein
MSMIDRRGFLGTSLGGLVLTLGASGCTHSAAQPVAADSAPPGKPDTLFLTWQRDPTTTMTAQWIGKPPVPELSTIQFSEVGKDQWQSVKPKERPYPMTDLTAFRAEMTGLTPGTEYQFRFGTQSPTFRFRTMPAKATDSFHFISGGDCGINPHAVANNIIAAKQDPMFALIGGDLGYDNGKTAEISLQFVRNYSQHMIDGKGRLIPMVVGIGNHEVTTGYNGTRKDAPFYFALHDGLYPERSYATLDFGDYLSLVLLDTGHIAPIGGEQTAWLDKALAERVDRPHLIVVNHVPAYPSYRAFDSNGEKVGTGEENRKFWVPLFEKHNVDIVLEHHDHTFKRTHPLKDGLVDPNGIVYLGDGSWGMLRVPKKPAERPYLAHTEEMYHLTLHRLEGEQNFHMAIDETGRIIDICRTTKKPRGKSVG